MGLGIRGWRRVGLGICKVGGVGSRSNHVPWILCSAVRTISIFLHSLHSKPAEQMKSSDVKASKCRLKLSSKISIFLRLLGLCPVIAL